MTVHGRLDGERWSRVRGVVRVVSRPRTGGAFEPVAARVQTPTARFSFKALSGPSRTLRFRWAGTGTVRPAAAEIAVLVPARTSIKVDRRRVLNGDSVTFRGRLVGRPLPDGGKLVDLQVKLRGRWRTFAAPRADAAGRWSYVYRFEATRGLVATASGPGSGAKPPIRMSWAIPAPCGSPSAVDRAAADQ